jgi:hypothetical protein
VNELTITLIKHYDAILKARRPHIIFVIDIIMSNNYIICILLLLLLYINIS